MSAGALFAVGAVVFFIGGLGIIIVGLELFGAWAVREEPSDAGAVPGAVPGAQTPGSAVSDPVRRER